MAYKKRLKNKSKKGALTAFKKKESEGKTTQSDSNLNSASYQKGEGKQETNESKEGGDSKKSIIDIVIKEGIKELAKEGAKGLLKRLNEISIDFPDFNFPF